MATLRGRAYQQLVSEVARAFDPGAAVTEGEWVKGPDGRLDMDVAIRGLIDGRPHLGVIECKDFNVQTTGKVGREFVDALDSKRHDLGASIAMICSNSGFTGDALRKAKRKGIGMISVLRSGDNRVKAVIHEEILLRRVRFGEWRFTYHGAEDISTKLGAPSDHFVRFDGRSVDAWLQHRAQLVAIANACLSERLRLSFRFKQPLTFACGREPLLLNGVEVEVIYNTQWLSQTVRLDATLGLYDYLRGRVRLAPGQNQYVIGGINWETAEACDPPNAATPLETGWLRGELDVTLTMIEGLHREAGLELPVLEPHVVPDDLGSAVPSQA
jgi:Restriction endonuclease